ncbi:unnamed protein product [Rotaria socialis]|uniref:Uncharacterized protein n=1 Tax=Rotaria socialis TaxID=392032 RepID=A0A817P876_9BILA|nr:unnamed protein product [Rotaria socialis]
MSTFQQNQLNGFSPILISPSSTSNTTITNNQILLFDNSDQGSVDSDYTSLASSKVYGNGGSTSSLHHQGRSQSFDELASTTTTIPTRHFNGTLNVNKSNNDPLQFVKIHPNHDLIERAQEQLTLLESRKRLQENFKLNINQNNDTNNNNNNNNNNKLTNLNDDDEANWSKAVESWRQKREQKRKQSTNSARVEDDPTISNNGPSSLPSPIKKFDEPQIFSPTPPPTIVTPPPPPPPPAPSTITAINIPNPIQPKSPTPPRHRGPGRIHELFIQKPVDIRGFGFKLDGGPAQNRPIYISTLEDGSPADKAGLCIDDEIVSMNDENIQNMTFDQVRKILKERNLRGSIKLIVKTYEDVVDDNSQTVTIQHSRTPSPQKSISNLQSNISVSPIATTATTTTTTTTSTILVSSTVPSNIQSPVYTFLPAMSPSQPSYTSTSDAIFNAPVHQITPTPLNIFAPKPFRSTASINLDAPKTNDTNLTHSSPIEAFRKMLDPSNSISKNMKNETTGTIEQQSTTRDVVKTLLSNPTLISSNLIDPPSPLTTNLKSPPPPLTSVDTLLHGTLDLNINDQQFNDSPIAQVRSSVEKQMSQLQQELLHGFPHKQAARESRPVNIPIDLTNAALPNSTIKTPPSSSLSPSIQQSDSNFNHTRTTRTYGLKVSPHENTIHCLDAHKQPQLLTNYENQSVQEISSTGPMNRPLLSQLSDRPVNELRVNISSPPAYQQQPQKTTSIPIDEKLPPQRITSKQIHTTLNQVPKKSHYEDHSWINEEQKKSIISSSSAEPLTPLSSQLSSYNDEKKGNTRQTTPQTSYHQELQVNKQISSQSSAFNYGDSTDEFHHYQHNSRTNQQHQPRDFDLSNNRNNRSKHLAKSPIRTTINSNNNRVLSVSGKLRCSRCNDELGQGSAMVIESLGLYYHIECFRCFVCNIPLSSSFEGTDVRVRSNRLHCQNCFSDENGAWRSNV